LAGWTWPVDVASWANALPEAPTAMTAPSESARRTADESLFSPTLIMLSNDYF
jgi:hypothetical protein